jgi:DNA-binding transcriptional LysR family regulator
VGRGLREDPVDTWLREQGLARRVAVQVPSYVQALQVVSQTDLVAWIPKGLADSLSRPLSLAVVPPRMDPGSYEEYMFHPRRSANDPASLWLRQITYDVREDVGF